MNNLTILIIPAEGDLAETEVPYVKRLLAHYRRLGYRVKTLIYEHEVCNEEIEGSGIAINTMLRVRDFVSKYDFADVEIHAQGGLGAYVAYEFLRFCPEKIKNVFIIGGAPCEAMTGVAKIFHRGFIHLWYYFRWLVPFFADDPNPTGDEDIKKIKKSSTETMRANPRMYRKQITFIGQWTVPEDWKVPEDCRVYFVPNGDTVRPKWWDNTYNNVKAEEFWTSKGAAVTERPGENFSFYSMMPAEALFAVMDVVR